MCKNKFANPSGFQAFFVLSHSNTSLVRTFLGYLDLIRKAAAGVFIYYFHHTITQLAKVALHPSRKGKKETQEKEVPPLHLSTLTIKPLIFVYD